MDTNSNSAAEPAPARDAIPPYSWVVLGLLLLAIFSSLGLGRFGYSMILPAMQDDLGLSHAQTGQLQSWTSLGYVAFVVVAGALAARLGPRWVIAVALLLVGTSMLATGLFTAFALICAARLATGIGSAGANVPAMGLVPAWFPASRRGLAAGIVVTGSSLGLMVSGAVVPGMLRDDPAAGWRQCWSLYGTIALVGAALCALLLRDHPDTALSPSCSEDSADAAGAEATPPPSPTQPLPSLIEMLRLPFLRRLAVVYFAFGFSYIIYATYFVKHVQREWGLSHTDAGTLWLRIGMGPAVSGFIWGTLSDRFGRRPVLVVIFLIQGTSYATVGLGNSLAVAYTSGILFALTAFSIPAVVAAAAGDAFGPRLAPRVVGFVTLAFGIGQVLGPIVAGCMADVTGALALPFCTAAATAVVLGGGGSLLLSQANR